VIEAPGDADAAGNPRGGRPEDAAFAELAQRNTGLLFRVAHGLLRNPHDAEDAVQECLLKLYRTGAWRHIEEERAFLARAVWRTGLDLIARRPRGGAAAEFDESASLVSADATPEAAVLAADERARLRALIDALPEELRQPLVLSAIEEMTSREVGEVLGLPDATVRTRVARARAELRRRFARLNQRTVR
jgi:RNA polymerase sigma-70 factor (ECF subfamily)